MYQRSLVGRSLSSGWRFGAMRFTTELATQPPPRRWSTGSGLFAGAEANKLPLPVSCFLEAFEIFSEKEDLAASLSSRTLFLSSSFSARCGVVALVKSRCWLFMPLLLSANLEC
ncbi:hypothetical protein I7I48_00489 [Histoplasma ohiense]|nr:hypothetical protein I7I48_00489 [Histoplasma ohiense (nom. inval.)]